MNCNCRLIDRIYLFFEDPIGPWMDRYLVYRHPKLTHVPVATRMTFEDYFLFPEPGPDSIRIIANSDIHFDGTLDFLRKVYFDNTLICLSRTEPDGGEPEWSPGQRYAPNSQDAWIYRPPIRNFRRNWRLGTEGCDNVLAYEAARAGIRLINPWTNIKAWHIHQTGVRRNRVRREGAPAGTHHLVPVCCIPPDCPDGTF
jgi:hypothetical protein